MPIGRYEIWWSPIGKPKGRDIIRARTEDAAVRRAKRRCLAVSYGGAYGAALVPVRGSEQSNGRGKGLLHTTVSFDPETFEQIHAYRNARDISFAAAVRDLVEIGLVTIEEDTECPTKN